MPGKEALMADLVIAYDKRWNIEEPAHAACTTDAARFEMKRALEEWDREWARTCGVCRKPLWDAGGSPPIS